MTEIIGKITAIKAQKNNKDRVSIFVDGEFIIGIDKELLFKHNLSRGDKIAKKDLVELEGADEISKAKKAALNLLSYRKRSEAELRKRLADKDYSRYSINEVIEILTRIDYIDDKEFARLWTRDKQRKFTGPLKIRMQLQKKEVEEKIINQILAEEYSNETEKDIAFKFVRKRIKRYNGESYQQQKRKLFQALKRRGFSFTIINDVLEEILVEGD